jgi:hypothetical protein
MCYVWCVDDEDTSCASTPPIKVLPACRICFNTTRCSTTQRPHLVTLFATYAMPACTEPKERNSEQCLLGNHSAYHCETCSVRQLITCLHCLLRCRWFRAQAAAHDIHQAARQAACVTPLASRNTCMSCLPCLIAVLQMGQGPGCCARHSPSSKTRRRGSSTPPCLP